MPETVIAFDFGTHRIGVAVGDLGTGIAHPLTTIQAKDNHSRFAQIDTLIQEWQPVRLVVGLPLHLDGEAHELTRLCQKFSRSLLGRFHLPVSYADERLSSVTASRHLHDQGKNTRQQKPLLDKAAAAEILQGYFNTLRSDALN